MKFSKLITDAENYLKEHFDKDYYQAVKASCAAEKAAAKARHQQKVAELEKEHKATMAKLSDHQEIKMKIMYTKTESLMLR